MMVTEDSRVDAYIADVPAFAQPLLRKVRRAFHVGCPGLTESIKWSRPAFEFHGLLGGMGSFKAHISYGFFRAKELGDPEGLFPRKRADLMMLRAEVAGDLPTQKILASYVRRAAALNAERASKPAGASTQSKKKAPRPAPEVPASLRTGLAKSRKANAFFETLPPGAQREYIEWITEAKREATRDKRLATALGWLAEGKRRNWKYENC